MTAAARPALRYHGSKFRLAPWVLSFFPAHDLYVEPFGGAAGILIQKPRVHGEVYNDLDGEIVNFFRCLRDEGLRARLVEACALTPYAREEFDLAWTATDDPIERARRTAVRAQMGFGSAGATQGTTGFRTDVRRKWSTAQHDWSRYPEAIAAVGERFAGVLIENRPAIEVMQQHDGPDCLHYVDPPYVHDTRVIRKGNGYRYELTDDDHIDLLESLEDLQGMVVLSGYDCDLYHQRLAHWQVHRTSARASGGRGTSLRTEVVWLNQACISALAGCAGQGALGI